MYKNYEDFNVEHVFKYILVLLSQVDNIKFMDLYVFLKNMTI